MSLSKNQDKTIVDQNFSSIKKVCQYGNLDENEETEEQINKNLANELSNQYNIDEATALSAIQQVQTMTPDQINNCRYVAWAAELLGLYQ